MSLVLNKVLDEPINTCCLVLAWQTFKGACTLGPMFRIMLKHDCPPSPPPLLACTHTATSTQLPLVIMSCWENMTTIFLTLWLIRSLLFRYGTLTFADVLLMQNAAIDICRDGRKQGKHSDIFMSVLHSCACAWASIPCRSTPFPTVPGQRKWTVLEHCRERSQPNMLGYSTDDLVWVRPQSLLHTYVECLKEGETISLLIHVLSGETPFPGNRTEPAVWSS